MRAVLFDFGGTLDYPRHWLDRFVAHYHAAGLSITRRELDPAFDAATHAAYRSADALRNCGMTELLAFLVTRQLEFLRDGEIAGTARIARELGSEAIRREFVRRIGDAFVAESREGLAYSRAVLAALGPRLKLGVVSNFYGNLERILRDAGLLALFAAVADSGQLGIYKPDPAIYRAALAMLGVAASDAIMVGDSLTKDCAPAHGLGMRTVWLRHQGARPADDQARCHADFTIRRLEEFNDQLCCSP